MERKYSNFEIEEYKKDLNREYDLMEENSRPIGPTEPHRPLMEIVWEAREQNGN